MNIPNCPKCSYEYCYDDGDMFVCPDCGNEWNQNEVEVIEVRDSNGNLLQDGDTVSVIKDLRIGKSKDYVKIGTKAKNIKLRPGEDHDIDCKLDGFGAMSLKSEFVKKL